MILLGYIIRKFNVISAEQVKGLSNVLLTVIAPASVLSSGYQPYTKELASSLVLTFVMAVTYYVFALLITWALFTFILKNKNLRGVSVSMSVFASTGFIGFPMALMLFGEEGLLYAVVYNMVFCIIIFSVGIRLLGGKDTKTSWKSIFISPLMIASFIAVILFISPVKVPVFMQRSFEVVGNMTAPVSMMIIGAWMVGVNMKSIFSSGRSYLVIFLRLFAFPMFVLLILRLFDLSATLTGAFVLITALPIASFNVLFAEKYGGDTAYANKTMLLSLCFSIISIPIIMMLL